MPKRHAKLLVAMILIYVCLPGGFVAQAQDATPEPAASPVYLGLVAADSDGIGPFGQETVIGASIAKTYFNEQGGVAGRPLEFVRVTTAGDDLSAITAFELLFESSVVGIIGPTSSQQAFAALPLAEAAQIPVVGASPVAVGIAEIGDYIARVATPVSTVAPFALRAAVQMRPDVDTLGVLYATNEAYSRSETEIFQQAAQELGLNVATVQEFETTDTVFSTQVAAVMDAGADAVAISSLATDGSALVKQLRAAGFEGVIVAGNGLTTPSVFPICGSDCDGILVAQAYSSEADSAMNAIFRDAYIAQVGKAPAQYSAWGFAAVQVFVEALNALAAETDLASLPLPELHARLNDAILAGSYDTPLGTISFTPEGEVVQQSYYIFQLQANDDGTGAFVFASQINAES